MEKRSKTDRRIKAAFVIVVLAAVGAVWFIQRREPELKDWDTDFNAALQHAREARTNLVVFFTSEPMTAEDKKMMVECLRARETQRALQHMGYAKVHLTTKDNKAEAGQFGVSDTPAVLLLDPSGKIIRKQVGFMISLRFCTEFLGMSGKEFSELK